LLLQLASGSLGFHFALWPLCRSLISAGLDLPKAFYSFFNKRQRRHLHLQLQIAANKFFLGKRCVAADVSVAFTKPAAVALDSATITAAAAAVVADYV